MNPHLNYMMVQHRTAEVERAGERARLAAQVPARRRSLRDQNMITRPSGEPRPGATAPEIERAIGGAR
jgi:hypothetical protein